MNFRRVIYFRFPSEFYFRSHSYIWDSGGTTASCVWPEDHGRGRFYATYVAIELVTTSVGSVSRAAHIEADSHGRLLRPTLLDDVVSMIFSQNCYLLDSESTQRATKITTLPQVKYKADSTSKTWENWPKMEILLRLNQSGSWKLTRSQIYVRKIQDLSCYGECKQQRFFLSTIAISECNQLNGFRQWHDNGHLRSRDNVTMDGFCSRQRGNSWSPHRFFVAVDGICCREMWNVGWWYSRSPSAWSLLPYNWVAEQNA